MINFLEETIACLHENMKDVSDVRWIGRMYDTPYKTTWEDFCKKANHLYDDGYGEEEIPRDLVVVGDDFWLERYEYDGAKWWEFKTMPKEPAVTKKLELTYKESIIDNIVSNLDSIQKKYPNQKFIIETTQGCMEFTLKDANIYVNGYGTIVIDKE